MKVDNNSSLFNFKMRLSPNLAERVRVDIFKKNNSKFEQFNKLFEKIHSNTEPTTMVDLFSADGKTHRLVYSSELFPNTKFADTENPLSKKDISNLHIFLLNLCTKCAADNEMKLFFKAANEMLDNYTPVVMIKGIANNFKVDAIDKANRFKKYVDDRVWSAQSNNPNLIYF